ncbi:MAG: hypothetical protein KKD77_24500 [Gammaproteobacteria bacterium]|nr:hypothetical protein [Gammaproteobacteria bacterium]MBU2249929.1 hypothetical protein [Gammaproteobacteria bacterium]MBU2685585.1 hypothetical protein [Gammaproteobacteria bacterium]
MTNIEYVRLLVGATVSAAYTDVQIQAFLDLNDDDVWLAAATAIEAYATSVTGSETSERIGDYSYTKKDLDNLLALAARYRGNAGSGPVIDWGNFDLTAIGEMDEEAEV